jgi:uracil DNA glycosylase
MQELLAEARAKNYTPPIPGLFAVLFPSEYSLKQSHWGEFFKNNLRGWEVVIEECRKSGSLKVLFEALDHTAHLVVAPTRFNLFRAYREIPLNEVEVVFLGQDPYPTSDGTAATLSEINNMPHDEVSLIYGENYDEELASFGTPWSDTLMMDEKRPRMKFAKVPYAIGKSFAFPFVCQKEAHSYLKLREAIKCAYTSHDLHMDPGLSEWSKQGILMLNACPQLLSDKSSAKHMNIWTAWTTEVLVQIAKSRPQCAFVLLGNAAKAYTAVIRRGNADALILEAIHPSRWSPEDGPHIFSSINVFREKLNLPRIRW